MTKRRAAVSTDDNTQPTEAVPGNDLVDFPPAEETTANTQERQPGDESTDQPKRPFEPVRGWTQRYAGPVRYRKFTDATLKIIAFKFDVPANEKLPDEVLAVMRDHKQDKDGNPTGLKFQDTRKHGKIWAIPSDVEGRALADKIDFRLSELAQKMEQAQGRS